MFICEVNPPTTINSIDHKPFLFEIPKLPEVLPLRLNLCLSLYQKLWNAILITGIQTKLMTGPPPKVMNNMHHVSTRWIPQGMTLTNIRLVNIKCKIF